MRRIAWGLLLLFAFSVPWEFSLDLGEPVGDIARIVGLLLLLAAIPALLQAGRLRTPGPLQWLVLAFYLWVCCTSLWTVDQQATLTSMSSFFQKMIVVWLVWEFAGSPSDLRNLLCSIMGGSWVLALLTLADFVFSNATSQIRYAATGQDPNDVARFLDLGFPLAALLASCEARKLERWLALGYLPLGLMAVLLTGSREGLLAALAAGAGCALLLLRRARMTPISLLALPVLAVALWFTVPSETLERLGTITEQLQGSDLNQRWNIWQAGWDAFVRSPLFGSGAGSFVSAAGLAPIDTAHNTALSILVGGGLCGFFLAVAIVALSVWAAMQAHGPLRLAMLTSLVVWAMTSLVATVEENRFTWLLIALIALVGRLALEEPERLAACFPSDPTAPLAKRPCSQTSIMDGGLGAEESLDPPLRC
jgi:O-antigen ligase